MSWSENPEKLKKINKNIKCNHLEYHETLFFEIIIQNELDLFQRSQAIWIAYKLLRLKIPIQMKRLKIPYLKQEKRSTEIYS